MIGCLESLIKRVRRWASRSEWSTRLLGLSRSVGTATEPGLVLIQIDGFSCSQLERALEQGRMPFLRSLIQAEGYHLYTLYSGLPSNTPAFQGEFFYGVKGVVPGFSFCDRKTLHVIRMIDPTAAARVQKDLEEQGSGLLEGGSSYVGIYSGGAAESHFCPATFGWSETLRAVNPLTLGVILFWHGWSLVRTGALLILESILAVMDCIRGLIDGQDLWKELKFVPTRVVISILFREMATIGAAIDTNRGLPVIHLNYLGYDEQAHRRGPSSAFAHWTLKGIDDAIRRVWRAARRSARRDYDVWIFSDHGQEQTIPYPVETGRSIQEAVSEVFGQLSPLPPPQLQEIRGVQFQRARWLGQSLGGRFFNWLLRNRHLSEGSAPATVVTAMGPIGHIYHTQALEQDEKEKLARALVERAGIPLVLLPMDPMKARAWTASGPFHLPDEAARILGKDHPFLEEAARDLVALCHHPEAGDFVISGWRMDRFPLTFPIENGAHAGPGPEETRAFALLPSDTPVPHERDYLRPLDLREAALRILDRSYGKTRLRFRRGQEPETVRIMTYNVHRCEGMDGKLSPGRIARVIALYHPDIVALQELDVGRNRTGRIDQAWAIAHELEMDFHFHPSLQIAEEQYGNAVLSRHPMRRIRAGGLPGLSNWPDLEPRGALWVAVTVDGQEVQVINTHLGLWFQERLFQAEALVGPEWLANPDCRNPVILCGDFNALPGSTVHRRLGAFLRDAQTSLNNHQPKATWFGRYPISRIDHVFVSPTVTVLGVQVPRTELTRVASDHLPLIVDVAL